MNNLERNPLRIAIYSRVFYPSVGGVQVTSRCMARELCAMGYDVTVVTGTQLEDVQELSEGYRIIRKPTLFLLIHEFRRVHRVISKGGVSALAGLASIIAKKPLIIVHEMAGSPLRPSRNLYVAASNVLRRIIVRYADFHIAVSQACLESKSLPKGAHASVLYNPVDPHLRASIQTKTTLSIDVLYVGRLISGKGIYVLLAALRRFEQKGISLRVAFVGDGPEREAIAQAVINMQYVHVDIKGSLHGGDLARMYHEARLVVVPSLHLEGMGLVIAEAFAFGRPVVGSDQQVIVEVMGGAGVSFKNGDDINLFEKIKTLLSDPVLYHDLSEKAIQRAAMFSVTAYSQSLNNLIINLHKKND